MGRANDTPRTNDEQCLTARTTMSNSGASTARTSDGHHIYSSQHHRNSSRTPRTARISHYQDDKPMERATSPASHQRHHQGNYNERFDLPVMKAEELQSTEPIQGRASLQQSRAKWDRYLDNYEQLSKPERTCSSSPSKPHSQPARVSQGQPAAYSGAQPHPAGRQQSPSRNAGSPSRQRRPEQEAGFRAAVEKRREAEEGLNQALGREAACLDEIAVLKRKVAAFEKIVEDKDGDEEAAWQRCMKQLRFSATTQADNYLDNFHGENLNSSVRQGTVADKIVESMQMWSNRRRDKLHVAQSGLSSATDDCSCLVPLKWSGRVEDTIKAVVGPFCVSLDQFIATEGERWEEDQIIRANRARILCRVAHRLAIRQIQQMVRSWQYAMMTHHIRMHRHTNAGAHRASHIQSEVFRYRDSL